MTDTVTPAEPQTVDRGGTPYYTALPLAEFMSHVMQYAGDGIWRRQGYVVDRQGTHSLFPKDATGTYGLFVIANQFAEMADELGHPDDAADYRQLATSLGEAFHAKFWNPATTSDCPPRRLIDSVYLSGPRPHCSDLPRRNC